MTVRICLVPLSVFCSSNTGSNCVSPPPLETPFLDPFRNSLTLPQGTRKVHASPRKEWRSIEERTMTSRPMRVAQPLNRIPIDCAGRGAFQPPTLV